MRNGIIFTVIIVLLLSFTACDDGGTPPILGNTPAAVLGSIEEAFNSRDIDGLAGCLADDFTFHFDPNDIGSQIGDYTIPDTWGKEEFLGAVGKMFDEAYDIQMDINTSNVGTPDDNDIEYFAQDVEVNLLVMVDATNGFLADGVCDFEFVDAGSGAPDNWVLRNWRDRTWPTDSGGRTVNRASVGFILAVFE
jgi:hypothetical protein